MSGSLTRIARAISRHGGMLKLALGMTTVVASLMGLQTRAAAVDYVCCHLCNNPGGCSYSCSWCWNCMDLSTGQCWRCCEGYDASQSCLGGCPAACSFAFTVNGPC